jgi:hypothetical protein
MEFDLEKMVSQTLNEANQLKVLNPFSLESYFNYRDQKFENPNGIIFRTLFKNNSMNISGSLFCHALEDLSEGLFLLKDHFKSKGFQDFQLSFIIIDNFHLAEEISQELNGFQFSCKEFFLENIDSKKKRISFKTNIFNSSNQLNLSLMGRKDDWKILIKRIFEGFICNENSEIVEMTFLTGSKQEYFWFQLCELLTESNFDFKHKIINGIHLEDYFGENEFKKILIKKEIGLVIRNKFLQNISNFKLGNEQHLNLS